MIHRHFSQVVSRQKLQIASLLMLTLSVALPTHAAVTSPSDGEELTSNPVNITWTLGASEFWVRAFSNGSTVYDSGRLSSSTSSASVSFPASTSEMTIRLYEKFGSSSWSSSDTEHTINLDAGGGGGGDGDGGDNDTLASLNCAPGEYARYDAGSWMCDNPEDDCPPVLKEALSNLPIEIFYSISDYYTSCAFISSELVTVTGSDSPVEVLIDVYQNAINSNYMAFLRYDPTEADEIQSISTLEIPITGAQARSCIAMFSLDCSNFDDPTSTPF